MKRARRLPWSRWLALVAIVAAVWALAHSMSRSPLTGKRAPDLVLRTVAGANPDAGAVRLSAIDQPVVLDFWASWCAACKRSTPTLNKLEQFFGPRGVRFYGVNVESIAPSQVKAAHREFGFRFPSLQDADGLAQRQYGVTMLPTVVLIGRDGMVHYASSGVPDKSVLRTALIDVLAARKAQ